MRHREYIRIVEGSKNAVLMIHGIAGSPAHFRDLLPVVPEDWSVYNILLDGHGGTVMDFSATSMEKWKAQVASTVDQLLRRHEKLVIVAHSMGTLFALQAAVDHGDRIASLFLLAAPLRVRVVPDMLEGTLRVALRKVEGHATATAMVDDCSIDLNEKLHRYIGWAPRFAELLEEIRRVRGLLPRVRIPCAAFQSEKDELVSVEAVQDLQRNRRFDVTMLKDSGHFAYGADDMKLLQQRLTEMLK